MRHDFVRQVVLEGYREFLRISSETLANVSQLEVLDEGESKTYREFKRFLQDQRPAYHHLVSLEATVITEPKDGLKFTVTVDNLEEVGASGVVFIYIHKIRWQPPFEIIKLPANAAASVEFFLWFDEVPEAVGTLVGANIRLEVKLGIDNTLEDECTLD